MAKELDWTPEEDQYIFDAVAKGLTRLQVVALVRTLVWRNREAIESHITKLGIKFDNKEPCKPLTAEVTIRLLELAQEGLCVREIADTLRLYTKTVRSRLTTMGFVPWVRAKGDTAPTRPLGRAPAPKKLTTVQQNMHDLLDGVALPATQPVTKCRFGAFPEGAVCTHDALPGVHLCPTHFVLLWRKSEPPDRRKFVQDQDKLDLLNEDEQQDQQEAA
jgi:hypothetical protein